ncbi:hypothetical protein IJT17_05100 [bacterium]|nr:hypothetical protein [bacterium]
MEDRVYVYTEWIKRHLPSDIPDDTICSALRFGGYYQDGLTIMVYGERGGPDQVVFEAKDEHDLCLWQFEIVCERIAGKWEMANRNENSRKWRWLRDHAENGRWLYVEQRDYFYNAIEDTRLASSEVFLKLIKNGLPADKWEEKVRRYVRLMNRWYKRDHWDYDRKALCFIEISDSKEYASDHDDTEEPAPDQIIRVV